MAKAKKEDFIALQGAFKQYVEGTLLEVIAKYPKSSKDENFLRLLEVSRELQTLNTRLGEIVQSME